jgi:hypothetical protein
MRKPAEGPAPFAGRSEESCMLSRLPDAGRRTTCSGHEICAEFAKQNCEAAKEIPNEE